MNTAEKLAQDMAALGYAPVTEEQVQTTIARVKEDLWLLRNQMPLRPEGSNEEYVVPARFFLPLIKDSLLSLEQAEGISLSEIPARIKAEARQGIRRGFGWQELAEKEPEVRRYYQVVVVREALAALIDDLANEGRPRQKLDLKIGAMRIRGVGKYTP